MTSREDVKFLESLKTEAAFMYTHLLEMGKNESEAIEVLKEVADSMDLYRSKSEGITVAIRFELDLLKENTDWDNLNYKGKCDLLWSLGMDTRSYKYEEGELFVGENTKEGYVYETKTFIYGQERLDSAWISKKKPTDNGMNFVYYASEEARNFAWFRKHGKGAMM